MSAVSERAIEAAIRVRAQGLDRPFSAYRVEGGEVEPVGAFWSSEEALTAAGMTGGVFVGRELETWHPYTSEANQRLIMEALMPEYLREQRKPAPPPEPEDPIVADARAALGKEPSRHQMAFFRELVRCVGHILMIARAGTGKSTTIVAGTKLLPETSKILMMVFNTDMETELQERTAGMKNVTVLTSHKFGNRTMRKAWNLPKLKPRGPGEGLRLTELLKEILPPAFADKYLSKVRELVCWARFFLATEDSALAQLASRRGIAIDWTRFRDPKTKELLYKDSHLFQWVRDALLATHKPTNLIDQDDSVYLPVALGVVDPEYDVVMIDESQDWTVAQRKMAMMALKPGGRIIAVGDDFQAIYGFRGANPESIPNLRAELSEDPLGLTELLLPVTYRCGSAIVALARRFVPDIESREGAHRGIVEDNVPYARIINELSPRDFVVGRTNAALTAVFLKCLTNKIPAKFKEEDPVGGLLKIISRNDITDINKFLNWLRVFIPEQSGRHEAYGRDDLALQVRSQGEALRAIAAAPGINTVEDLKNHIEELSEIMSTGEQVEFYTVHGAKGLEADRVWLLRDTFRVSSGEREELNLYYVAVTRAKHHLFVVGGEA